MSASSYARRCRVTGYRLGYGPGCGSCGTSLADRGLRLRLLSQPDSSASEASQSCIDEPTQPLTETELTQALRRHGLTVYPIPGDAICDAPPSERMPISVGNLLFDGPQENIDEHDQISRSEGHVFCGLRRAPIWGWKLDEDLDAPPASPIFSGEKATFKFANLECTIYPKGSEATSRFAISRAVRDLVSVARKKLR